MKQTLKIGITIVVVAALTMSGIALAQTDDEVPVGEGASRGVAAIVQRLGPLVEAGTIDQDQAQAVAETLADGMAFRRPQQRRPAHGLRAAAEFLGMEVDDLAAQLRGGATLAVHLVRLLSVAMSTFAVYLTWLIVREVAPDRPCLALGAAGIHAFTPMVVFISGAVNNDNLVVPLCSLALLLLLRLLRIDAPAGHVGGSDDGSHAAPLEDGDGSDLRSTARNVPVVQYLMLGVVLGLAALTKTSSLALTLLTALVVTIRAVRRRS